MQKQVLTIFTLPTLLLLANIASSQETDTIGNHIGVRLQPVPVYVEFSYPRLFATPTVVPGQQSLLRRPVETVYNLGVDWRISFWQGKAPNRRKHRLIDLPLYLLEGALGKQGVVDRAWERRTYPDFINN